LLNARYKPNSGLTTLLPARCRGNCASGTASTGAGRSGCTRANGESHLLRPCRISRCDPAPLDSSTSKNGGERPPPRQRLAIGHGIRGSTGHNAALRIPAQPQSMAHINHSVQLRRLPATECAADHSGGSGARRVALGSAVRLGRLGDARLRPGRDVAQRAVRYRGVSQSRAVGGQPVRVRAAELVPVAWARGDNVGAAVIGVVKPAHLGRRDDATSRVVGDQAQEPGQFLAVQAGGGRPQVRPGFLGRDASSVRTLVQ
jgi:hypothetical protein